MVLDNSLLIANIILFILACISACIKYEHYAKLFQNGTIYNISYRVRSIFRVIGTSVIDKYDSTKNRVFESDSYWQSYNKCSSDYIVTSTELSNPFFSRPKPVILEKVISRKSEHHETFNYYGTKEIPLYGSYLNELWINITNHGKTSVKRMRARAKLYPVPKKQDTSELQRPNDISEEKWQEQSRGYKEFIEKTELERTNSIYGRPLPFSRTPKGTMGFPWFQVGAPIAYETDLTPQSDEASVMLITTYRFGENTTKEFYKAGLIKTTNESNLGILKIGNDLLIITNPSNDQRIKYEFVVKFWIISENVLNEVSEIFHIEIPSSLNSIISTKLKKRSKQYKEFDKLLSV